MLTMNFCIEKTSMIGNKSTFTYQEDGVKALGRCCQKSLLVIFAYIRVPLAAFIVFYLGCIVLNTFFPDVYNLATASFTTRSSNRKSKIRETIEANVSYNHPMYIPESFIAYRMSASPCACTNTTTSQRRPERKNIIPEAPIQHDPSAASSSCDTLFLVTSSVRNYSKRKVFRIIYGTHQNTSPLKIKVIFLVGLAQTLLDQATLELEDFQHQDIVQGNFLDSYANLTFKTIMGYRWVTQHCRNIKLMLKMDDDVFVDIFKFVDYFQPKIKQSVRSLYCLLNIKPKVFRQGKYRVRNEEYSGSFYPEFCSGYFVVPSMDVLDDINDMAKITRFFRLEDVFTYGFVRERLVDVQPIHLDIITFTWNDYLLCVKVNGYNCKYIAIEAPDSDSMMFLHDQMMKFRDERQLVTNYR